ncbi:sigma-70 family RNA polymerase sigma factor [PVC group bacterium]|nr:sigma-70 family RNA polymerase sigma factor [PVC group bacterium]
MNSSTIEIQRKSSTPETWVDHYGDYLYRYALSRLRNAGLAENLVQETFLAALHSRDRFSGLSTEKTWLTGILKHKIVDHFRKNYREHPVSDFVNEDESVDEFFTKSGIWKNQPGHWTLNPAELLENKEFWEVFKECLNRLSGPMADAFMLSTMEGMKTDEICKILNVTQNNLWVLLHRARMKLRQSLENCWFQN